MSDLLSNEEVVNAIGLIVAALFAVATGSSVYAKLGARQRLVIRILSAAAEHAYKAYVRRLKESKGGEKMSLAERRTAMDLAKRTAREAAQQHAITDPVFEDDLLLESEIEKAVRVAKAEAKPKV